MTPDPGEPGAGRGRAKSTVPVVSCVFEPGSATHRYLTAVVVELPDGTWEHRDIPVRDWIVLGPDEPVRTGYLSRLRPYLDVDFAGGRPVDRKEAS